jgi:hypothetical protein
MIDTIAYEMAENFDANQLVEFKEMMFRFCLARLYRGEFNDWTGWEYRDDWTVSTYQQPKRWRMQETDSITILILLSKLQTRKPFLSLS